MGFKCLGFSMFVVMTMSVVYLFHWYIQHDADVILVSSPVEVTTITVTNEPFINPIAEELKRPKHIVKRSALYGMPQSTITRKPSNTHPAVLKSPILGGTGNPNQSGIPEGNLKKIGNPNLEKLKMALNTYLHNPALKRPKPKLTTETFKRSFLPPQGFVDTDNVKYVNHIPYEHMPCEHIPYEQNKIRTFKTKPEPTYVSTNNLEENKPTSSIENIKNCTLPWKDIEEIKENLKRYEEVKRKINAMKLNSWTSSAELKADQELLNSLDRKIEFLLSKGNVSQQEVSNEFPSTQMSLPQSAKETPNGDVFKISTLPSQTIDANDQAKLAEEIGDSTSNSLPLETSESYPEVNVINPAYAIKSATQMNNPIIHSPKRYPPILSTLWKNGTIPSSRFLEHSTSLPGLENFDEKSQPYDSIKPYNPFKMENIVSGQPGEQTIINSEIKKQESNMKNPVMKTLDPVFLNSILSDTSATSTGNTFVNNTNRTDLNNTQKTLQPFMDSTTNTLESTNANIETIKAQGTSEPGVRFIPLIQTIQAPRLSPNPTVIKILEPAENVNDPTLPRQNVIGEALSSEPGIPEIIPTIKFSNENLNNTLLGYNYKRETINDTKSEEKIYKKEESNVNLNTKYSIVPDHAPEIEVVETNSSHLDESNSNEKVPENNRPYTNIEERDETPKVKPNGMKSLVFDDNEYNEEVAGDDDSQTDIGGMEKVLLTPIDITQPEFGRMVTNEMRSLVLENKKNGEEMLENVEPVTNMKGTNNNEETSISNDEEQSNTKTNSLMVDTKQKADELFLENIDPASEIEIENDRETTLSSEEQSNSETNAHVLNDENTDKEILENIQPVSEIDGTKDAEVFPIWSDQEQSNAEMDSFELNDENNVEEILENIEPAREISTKNVEETPVWSDQEQSNAETNRLVINDKIADEEILENIEPSSKTENANNDEETPISSDEEQSNADINSLVLNNDDKDEEIIENIEPSSSMERTNDGEESQIDIKKSNNKGYFNFLTDSFPSENNRKLDTIYNEPQTYFEEEENFDTLRDDDKSKNRVKFENSLPTMINNRNTAEKILDINDPQTNVKEIKDIKETPNLHDRKIVKNRGFRIIGKIPNDMGQYKNVGNAKRSFLVLDDSKNLDKGTIRTDYPQPKIKEADKIRQIANINNVKVVNNREPQVINKIPSENRQYKYLGNGKLNLPFINNSKNIEDNIKQILNLNNVKLFDNRGFEIISKIPNDIRQYKHEENVKRNLPISRDNRNKGNKIGEISNLDDMKVISDRGSHTVGYIPYDSRQYKHEENPKRNLPISNDKSIDEEILELNNPQSFIERTEDIADTLVSSNIARSKNEEKLIEDRKNNEEDPKLNEMKAIRNEKQSVVNMSKNESMGEEVLEINDPQSDNEEAKDSNSNEMKETENEEEISGEKSSELDENIGEAILEINDSKIGMGERKNINETSNLNDLTVVSTTDRTNESTSREEDENTGEDILEINNQETDIEETPILANTKAINKSGKTNERNSLSLNENKNMEEEREIIEPQIETKDTGKKAITSDIKSTIYEEKSTEDSDVDVSENENVAQESTSAEVLETNPHVHIEDTGNVFETLNDNKVPKNEDIPDYDNEKALEESLESSRSHLTFQPTHQKKLIPKLTAITDRVLDDNIFEQEPMKSRLNVLINQIIYHPVNNKIGNPYEDTFATRYPPNRPPPLGHVQKIPYGRSPPQYTDSEEYANMLEALNDIHLNENMDESIPFNGNKFKREMSKDALSKDKRKSKKTIKQEEPEEEIENDLKEQTKYTVPLKKPIKKKYPLLKTTTTTTTTTEQPEEEMETEEETQEQAKYTITKKPIKKKSPLSALKNKLKPIEPETVEEETEEEEDETNHIVPTIPAIKKKPPKTIVPLNIKSKAKKPFKPDIKSLLKAKKQTETKSSESSSEELNENGLPDIVYIPFKNDNNLDVKSLLLLSNALSKGDSMSNYIPESQHPTGLSYARNPDYLAPGYPGSDRYLPLLPEEPGAYPVGSESYHRPIHHSPAQYSEEVYDYPDRYSKMKRKALQDDDDVVPQRKSFFNFEAPTREIASMIKSIHELSKQFKKSS